MNNYQSWGKYPIAEQDVRLYVSRTENLPISDNEEHNYLGYGNGRSYGDSCLNHRGVLIATRTLNNIIHFDSTTGIIHCEAGVLLSEILQYIVSSGWFLQVTPGTKYVTVGGAIANDVHGKNHHRTGTFGRHVLEFELLRSDGGRMLCSPIQNSEWFCATIGGLGLTGIITWAKIQLRPINNPFMNTETIRYSGLEEFFELSSCSDIDFEYTVAWLDCMAKRKALGRGLFSRGNHSPPITGDTPKLPGKFTINLPINLPVFMLNKYSVKAFNILYYNKQRQGSKSATTHYDPFFYPLDAINNWNRMYGKRGFMQYQCVVPLATGYDTMKEIIRRISQSGYGSFLAVLKVFGDLNSPGMMSFPRKGVTLALDFPNHGLNVFKLLNDLDSIVCGCNGAVYPAKDARMSAASFQKYYPQWEKFQAYIDPRFSSSFWRRVTGK